MAYAWVFWGFSILLQIIFVVHVLARGHDLFWIFIILLFPVVGCTVYALIVWIPDMRHSRTTRRTSKALIGLFDPRRELRKRLGSLDVSDTVENRVSLAKELARHGMTKDALALYERSLKGVYEDDPYLLVSYAGALFDAGYLPDARAMLDKARAKNPSFKSAEAQLLHARVLQQLGETAAADHAYQTAVTQHGGSEAKCRYAQFLQQQGRGEEAKTLFEDIIRSNRHGTRHSRRLNKEWINFAKKNLTV